MAAIIINIERKGNTPVDIAVEFPGGGVYHYGSKLSEHELHTMADFLNRGCVGLTRWMIANNIMPRSDRKE